MAFMEILKIIQHQVFLRNCRGKVLEKFPLFRHDRRIMRVFHAGKRRLPAWTRPQLAHNAFTERAPKSRIGLSRGDVGQLSVERWGRYKPGRQAYEHAIVTSLGPAETVKRAASHWVWLTRLKEAGSGRDSHRTE